MFEPMEARLLLDNSAVIINEIMYHPGFGEPGQAGFVKEDLRLEYIELYNKGAAAVSLRDWQFTQGITFTLPDVSISAGQYLVVAADVAAFHTKYPTVNLGKVVGGWTGRLGNSGQDLELEDSLGQRMDIVHYADEGDWSVRLRGPLDYNHRGWTWSEDTDGVGGKSLELININLSNTYGQNWGASLVRDGTPGAAKSIAAADIPPVILEVKHSPEIPRSTDPVTVTARLVDELPAPASVTLYWRLDANPQTTPFQSAPMYDDGQHGDGLAGDGVYGATITQQANLAIVEFYVEARDAGNKVRTWPGPVPGLGQAANLLYQVDNAYDPTAKWTPGAQPVYRLIMTAAEATELYNIVHSGDRWSDAQMNGTFISLDGTGIKTVYQVGIRNRGGGSRSGNGTAQNYHVNFPHDTSWQDLGAISINFNYTDSQAMGSTVFQMAGLAAPDETPVQVRVNGANLALASGVMFNTYVAKEGYDTDFAAAHFPDDSSGNLYIQHDDIAQADLRYLGTNPDSYRNRYFKQTNVSDDDYSDIINLTYVLANASDANFVQEVGQVIDLNQWIRYIAADTLAGNREGGLYNGNGDDYGLYRGTVDTRFRLVPWDLDTLLGINSGGQTAGIFDGYTNIPALNRILTHPDTVILYYQQLMDLMNTVFAPANFNPLVDRVLGSWVPPGTLDTIKSFVVARNASVLSQIPHGGLTATSGLALSGGYPRSTVDSFTVNGAGDATRTRSVTVSGQPATWDARNGTWTFTSAAGALKPGINRLTVQGYDGHNGTGNLISTTSYDIWYDTGATNDYPKGGGEPPPPPPAPVLTTELLVRDSYLPGVPVLVRVDALTDGAYNRGLWDATATLTVDNPGITLSTNQVTLYNGVGSAFVTFTGTGSFTLTADIGGLQATKTLADLTGQPQTAVSGALSGAGLTWSGVVHVTGDVLVPDGLTLTVQPGTLVLLDGVASGTTGTDIDVQGAIQAAGTAVSPITFTAYNPTLAWGEMHFSSAEPSLFQYTDVTRAGRSPVQGHTGTGPAFNVTNSTITFDHAAIGDTVGKTMQSAATSDLTFRDSLLTRSVMGPELAGTALLFENSWIVDMHNVDDADAIYIHDQAGGQTVRLVGGVGANTDDDNVDTLGSDITIENYIIRDSKDKGVSVYGGTATIKYSLIVDNNKAPEDPTVATIAAKTMDRGTCTVNIDHSTIVTSKVVGFTDYAIQSHNKYGVGAGTITWNVTNSILQATDPINTQAPYLDADIHVSYSDVYGEAWPGAGNLNQDPQFVDAAGHNFHLQAGSPAVDAGDPAAPADPDLTVTDMGVYYHDQGAPVLPAGSLTEDTVWTP
ncbi:MAG: CotH kinase family protein, partial [Planctomycetota bacterium]|nr:CotH kinase family protein [Planctomycetota bacterium]